MLNSKNPPQLQILFLMILLSKPTEIILHLYNHKNLIPPCANLKIHQQKPTSPPISSCSSSLDYSEAVSDPSFPTFQNNDTSIKPRTLSFLSPSPSAASSPSSAIKLYNGKSQSMLNIKLWLCGL